MAWRRLYGPETKKNPHTHTHTQNSRCWRRCLLKTRRLVSLPRLVSPPCRKKDLPFFRIAHHSALAKEYVPEPTPKTASPPADESSRTPAAFDQGSPPSVTASARGAVMCTVALVFGGTVTLKCARCCATAQLETIRPARTVRTEENAGVGSRVRGAPHPNTAPQHQTPAPHPSTTSQHSTGHCTAS